MLFYKVGKLGHLLVVYLRNTWIMSALTCDMRATVRKSSGQGEKPVPSGGPSDVHTVFLE